MMKWRPLHGPSAVLTRVSASASSLFPQAFARLDANPEANLAISDLKGFGRDFTWALPEYDAMDLRYTNMFHCSAVMHRSLWDSVPGGYPTTTLFG